MLSKCSRTVACLTGGLLLTLLASWAWVRTADVPSFDAVRARAQSSDAWLLDRQGEPLHRLRLDYTRRQLSWVSLHQVSPALLRAVVMAEDQRFYTHQGIDGRALLVATAQALGLGGQTASRRGASTITMQVAGLLFERALGRPGQRSLWQKFRQMRFALALERHWTKDQILEAYLNQVAFRHELIGVEAAAHGLFRVGPQSLDAVQSAILAVLLRAPSASRRRVGGRACALLQRLDQHNDCDRVQWIASVLPQRPYPLVQGSGDAPHLARRMLSRPGERVRATLDALIQRKATEVLQQHLVALTERNVHDGAVIIMDNASGEVLAYVGSSGALSDAAQFDAAQALRQPGSTLKPFLYATALDQGWLTAASLLEDTPVAFATPLGLYSPQNYDRDFKGAVTMRTALASSLNVPAVRTLTHVGVRMFYHNLRALGLDTLTRDPDYYGLGLALGDGEVTLMALTNAYRALANGGTLTAPKFIMSEATQPVVAASRVFTQASSFIVADVLSDDAARAPTFGLSSVLNTRVWSAVKTGTSKDMRDNWAVGFTPRYTVGVWVGNASGEPMWDVSGMSGAAPVWHVLVDYLHKASSMSPPKPPQGVVQHTVRFEHNVAAERTEWFITGTQPQGALQRLKPAQVAPQFAQFLQPSDGVVIAPDPDVPAKRQRIMVQSTGADAALCLQLDAQTPFDCGQAQWLLPLPPAGVHTLSLVLKKNQKAVDTLTFTVQPGGAVDHRVARTQPKKQTQVSAQTTDS